MTSTLPPLIQAFSGAIGSSVANAGSYPLDLVGTKVQTTRSKEKQGIISALTILQRIFTKRGLPGLYDGLKTDTAATFLSNFFYFYAYSFLRSVILRRKSHSISTSKSIRSIQASPAAAAFIALEELGIGFIAGVASRAISTPLALITVRLQNVKETHEKALDDHDSDELEDNSDVVSIIKQIYKTDGLLGFWRGFETTVMLCLNPSITLFLYQAFRRVFLRGKDRGTPSPRQAFIGAAFSNAIAVAILYPLILAKTRLQTSRSRSIMGVWKAAYKRDGVPGLYQGVEVQLLKGFLSQGLTMTTKQRIEQLTVYLYQTWPLV